MKILEWNIKHGGSRERIPKILDSIGLHNPDVVVLTEFRANHQDSLIHGFGAQGYSHFLSSNPEPKTNGILVASKFKLSPINSKYVKEGARQRWLEIEIVEKQLRLLCIHIPGAGDVWGKEDFWKSVIEYARDNESERAIMIGDFNTGLDLDAQGTPFKFSNYMSDLLNLGWVDVWRDMNPQKREYSWYSNMGNGFRLDYLYSTKKLTGMVSNVCYHHTERIDGYSDHSILTTIIK